MSTEREERPWGSYEVLAEGRSYKVKRIEVKPRQRLSLQTHDHRSEHWVIVSGQGVVTLGEQEFTCQVNDDVNIPAGTKHRIANPADVSLVFIEVQCGSYFGEDDIKRFADDYNRS
ncbi:MAG TPA: phosphomannose isomerase type II C-terminal cupin domain [Blastocatellia bacterium]|nr:phosphomannose isomerase type II C-terminal cupin domain [Blastocatellia bacterium]